ncbi:MAG: sigma-70 family RNA polymerase sigma factor, partial [Clostridia bacterium]|nr:sigma-70 family RNA polymerase sigma factor [Clostridia bacterium]
DSIDEPASRRILVEHNLRLVVYIAKKFETTGIGIEDLVSIGTIGLIKAVNTYKSDKQIKLATYASRCIENEILMFIRKTSGTRCEVSLDEPLNVDWDGNELLLGDLLGGESDDVFRSIEEREDRRMIRGALANLPCRDRTIIELRFGFARGGKELTQKEVADLLGISQSYISRLEKKIMARLRDDLKKVGY